MGIQPEMQDPDPDSMNPDPKHCLQYDSLRHTGLITFM
jgi:hypothetical protein